ncbi:putative membrane protein [Candidatus Phytoplasma solani]|uniref:hypothetical protein n=1 Tax=Candidatus Phytoplasma solani TaxID=69896 RepID=UPI0032DB747A
MNIKKIIDYCNKNYLKILKIISIITFLILGNYFAFQKYFLSAYKKEKNHFTIGACIIPPLSFKTDTNISNDNDA